MRFIALVLMSGCIAGGGPVVGIGERGFVYGAEVNAGVAVGPIGDVSVGYQSERDVIYSAASLEGPIGVKSGAPSVSAMGRAALGFGITSEPQPNGEPSYSAHGFAALGGGALTPVREAKCGAWTPVVMATIEVRYLTQWELMLVPRVEDYSPICGE